MSEKLSETNQTAAAAGESDGIMQDIQSMITELLVNTVDKMQKAETQKELGDGADVADAGGIPADMGLDEIKSFITVMQKFIDNINIMVMQLETGNMDVGATDEKFMDGYMATADNILEIAAFSMKDNLTGLSNRYGFDKRIILEWNRATRDKSALGLVIFAPDGLEKIEDSKKRDSVIKEVSQTLMKSSKRSTDFFARWSDDEFAALLPITDSSGTTIVVERIRMEIEKMDFTDLPKTDGKNTVSIGACVYTPEPGEHPMDFINKAHNAYKQIKGSGGDSVNFV